MSSNLKVKQAKLLRRKMRILADQKRRSRVEFPLANMMAGGYRGPRVRTRTWFQKLKQILWPAKKTSKP